MYSGKQPSIPASALGEEGRPEGLARCVAGLFPRMDGDETWRGAKICGVSAMYPGPAPSMLANMAPPKVLVIWLKMNCCIYARYFLVGRYGMEVNQSSTLLGHVREVIRYMYLSIRSERCYVEWVRRFVVELSGRWVGAARYWHCPARMLRVPRHRWWRATGRFLCVLLPGARCAGRRQYSPSLATGRFSR